nr:hypothetical protein GCM10010200_096830 [Actinomadura rugatobispora]
MGLVLVRRPATLMVLPVTPWDAAPPDVDPPSLAHAVSRESAPRAMVILDVLPAKNEGIVNLRHAKRPSESDDRV